MPNQRLVDHPLYSTWADMNQRCYNKNLKIYSYYGGRGIKVCEKWRRKKRRDEESFLNFVNDMGLKPYPTFSLHRINNERDYEPSNCCWASHSVQMKERRKFTRPNQRGLNHVNAKLSEQDAREIRQLAQTRKHGTISMLARQYNINRSSIYRIINNEMYSDL